MPVLNNNIPTLSWQLTEYLTELLTIVPAIAFQDVRLGGELFLSGIVVIEAHYLQARIGGFAETYCQELMTIGTIPVASRHILAIGTTIAYRRKTILGINKNGEVGFLVEYFLGNALFHRIADKTHHPRRPRLVKAFEHGAETAVSHVADGFIGPTFIDILERGILILRELGKSSHRGNPKSKYSENSSVHKPSYSIFKYLYVRQSRVLNRRQSARSTYPYQDSSR